jgi:hypothetical protein
LATPPRPSIPELSTNPTLVLGRITSGIANVHFIKGAAAQQRHVSWILYAQAVVRRGSRSAGQTQQLLQRGGRRVTAGIFRNCDAPIASMIGSGHGLPMRGCQHHGRCTRDTHRLAATHKSAALGTLSKKPASYLHTSGLMHCSNSVLFDHLVGADE